MVTAGTWYTACFSFRLQTPSPIEGVQDVLERFREGLCDPWVDKRFGGIDGGKADVQEVLEKAG